MNHFGSLPIKYKDRDGKTKRIRDTNTMSVMYIWLGFKMDGPHMPNQEVSNVKRFSPQKMFIYHVTVCH